MMIDKKATKQDITEFILLISDFKSISKQDLVKQKTIKDKLNFINVHLPNDVTINQLHKIQREEINKILS